MKDSAQLDAAKASLQWPWQPWKWNDVLVYSRAHLMVMVSEANHVSGTPMTLWEERWFASLTVTIRSSRLDQKRTRLKSIYQNMATDTCSWESLSRVVH